MLSVKHNISYTVIYSSPVNMQWILPKKKIHIPLVPLGFLCTFTGIPYRKRGALWSILVMHETLSLSAHLMVWDVFPNYYTTFWGVLQWNNIALSPWMTGADLSWVAFNLLCFTTLLCCGCECWLLTSPCLKVFVSVCHNPGNISKLWYFSVIFTSLQCYIYFVTLRVCFCVCLCVIVDVSC